MPNYEGFFDLKAFMAAADRDRPVSCAGLHEPGQAGKFGSRLDTLGVMVSQAGRRGVIYLWMVTGKLAFINGNQPWGPEHVPIRARAQAATDIVADILQQHGFTVEESVVSMPKSLKIVQGWVDGLTWDKDAARWVLEPVGEPVTSNE